MSTTNNDPRYPTGRYSWPQTVSAEDRARWIETIATAPVRLRAAVTGLSEAQLNTPYREGGWTGRQVADHLADSHMNSYIRFKLAMTENEPLIKPYDENAWAGLPDVASVPVETSVKLVEAVHERWVLSLKSMSESDWKKTFRHPERGLLTLERTLGLYAWHGDHHIAHIQSLR